MTVGATALRSVLRAHPSGVTVLTATGPSGPVGVTVTSFTSISAEPALIAVALADTSTTWRKLAHSEHFAIHLLGADQAATALRFATPGADRFAPPTAWHTGPYGVPYLGGCPGRLLCSRHSTVRLGDHHLLVGAVEQVEHGEQGDGLVHRHGSLQPVPTPLPART
ncbi:flavin reductase family protein [Streptomyces bacillaris]|uniref:Flavin reductase n=2 Tax=Streptomyces TaxID=1883 RepID=A0AAD0VF02_9ACTN|nr:MULTISPECIES: flavin reductase family protein [Streptomyces]NUW21939.1 flavin reductase family protein [Streptomyces roseoviolaceus]ATY96492.1 flavin reductase [Streptomyces cavourensis]AXI72352.1 flavin reductase [Streptomyces cavourensis]MBH0243334.1 flavin reductase family protein [Streptomyces cavourensis]NUV42386.1 flavin reductase family protein [Streptomyces sp. CAI-24]